MHGDATTSPHTATTAGLEARKASTFDAMRLVAAYGVLVGHHFYVAGRQQPTLGAYGEFAPFWVFVFFAISGYFIAGSWDRDPALTRYWGKRVLRVYPALVVTVVLTVFVIGPAVTDLSLSEYFSEPRTWSYLRNAVLVFWIQFDLPGVFGSNAVEAVNISLWSLPIEMVMYAVLSAVAYLTPSGRKVLYPLLAVLFCVGWIVSPEPVDFASRQMLALGAPFFVGATVHEYRLLRLISLPVMAAAGAALVGAAFLPELVGRPVLFFALPVLVLGLGSRPSAVGAAIAGFGDISYGVYLWAFPIQQLLVGLMGFVPSMVGALVLTTAAGWLSMRIVEVPALRHRPAPKDGREAGRAGQGSPIATEGVGD